MKELVDSNGGEIIQLPEQTQAIELYKNASMLTITPEEQKKLEEAIDEAIVEIRPDGFLYLPQVFYREKLNGIFGIGQWALIQHRDMMKDNKFFFDGSLLVRGCFISRAMGEANYSEDNNNQSWASALEAAKSDCLVRCCKDLGIGKELWMPQFSKTWVDKFAVKVWRNQTGKKRNGEAGSFQWRRKDAEPFYDESSSSNNKPPENKQPNQDKQKPAENKNQENKPSQDPEHGKMIKLLNTIGSKLYGDKWDDKRHELVIALTKKRKQDKPTNSSTECTKDELTILINKLNKKLTEQDEAIKQQHKNNAQKETAAKSNSGPVDVQKSLYDNLKENFSKCDNGIDFIKMLEKDSKLIDLVTDQELSTSLTILINNKAKELGVNLTKAA